MQCLGAICGAGVVKGFEGKRVYQTLGGGANVVAHGYTKGDGLGAEIVGTFILVYTVFSATDAKRNARDSHVPVCILFYFSVLFGLIVLGGTGVLQLDFCINYMRFENLLNYVVLNSI